jgi:hypothetical protein
VFIPQSDVANVVRLIALQRATQARRKESLCCDKENTGGPYHPGNGEPFIIISLFGVFIG